METSHFLPSLRTLPFLVLLLLAAMFFFSACRDHPNPYPPDDPPPVVDYTVLPRITQEGKNTFGCKVNGEVWMPRVPPLSVTIYDKAMSFDEKKV